MRILLISLVLLLNINVWSQPPGFDPEQFEAKMEKASFRELFETANTLTEDNLYPFAVNIWKYLAKNNPDNYNVNYKAGFCYLQINTERTKALPYLQKSLEGMSKKYDPFSYSEKNAPITTLFYLGKAYFVTANLDSAQKYLNQFIEEASKKHILYPEAQLELIQIENARVEMANKKNFIISNIGNEINGEYDDFGPVITADANTLFFTSRRLRTDTTQPSNAKSFSPENGKYFEDVYVSYRDMATGKWGEPQLMPFCSPRANQASISTSNDGSMLFIYKDDNGDGNIYYSLREDENYGDLEKLGSNINTEYWETHATISTDGKTLYFVSDRPGGLGGRDIYRCVKLPNGQWSKALNVGAPINTPYDEDSPYLHPDGKTMYFSSNGEKSMGGYDIFFSELNEEGKWTEPLNIGYPLNTVDDDVFFTTNAEGKQGFFSSAKDGGYGGLDIYRIELDTGLHESIAILKGYIDKGDANELPKGIVIWVSDLTAGTDPQKYQPNRVNGSYIFNLVPCHEYLAEYMQLDKTFYETEFTVPCNSGYQEINKVITLGGVALTGDKVDKTIDKNTDKWQYEILVNGKPYQLNGKATVIGEEDESYVEMITPNGTFRYKKLNSRKDPIFEIETTDPSLCDELTIRLVDEKGNIVKETKQDIRCKLITEVAVEPVEFKKYYGYNEKGALSTEAQFKAFVEGIKAIINARGYAKVEIEGSASKVPTKTFGSNNKLANARLADAKEYLLKRLKDNGIDISKIKVVSENALVQGPTYSGDFKNKEKYGKYQYIKLKAF